jgi:hypothetical protein
MKETRLHSPPDILNPLPVEGLATLTELEAVELRGIVAPRDHHTAIYREMKEGEVKEWCRADPHIDQIKTGRCHPTAKGILEIR